MPRVLLVALTYLLFLLSGATALVYQVAWSRSFVLIFGASHEAISIVLASFMAGLALGGLYFGRRSSRIRRPLRLYGYLELGIGLSALLIPAALRLIDDVYVGLAIWTGEVNAFLNFLRAAMAFSVLVVPTFFMGGTLPLLSRFVVKEERGFGVHLSGLYGTNTIGAVAGVVLGGFALLPALGVWRTELVAVSANLLIGLAAIVAEWSYHRATGGAPAAEEAVRTEAEVPLATASSRDSSWALRLTYWGTAVSGLSALALEVLWTRSLSVTTGLSVYSFTVMLAAFLLGISLGSWIHALLPLRRIPETVQFGVVFVLIGFSSLAVSFLIPRTPELGLWLGVRIFDGEGVTIGASLILSLAVMLVPCIFMGMAFPLAGQARARMRGGVGEPVGTVFGLNTIGAIVGSLGAGFLVIPFLGLQRGLLSVSAIYAAYGVLVLGASALRRVGDRSPLGRWSVGTATAAAAALVVVVMVVVPDRWDRRVLGGYSHNAPGLYVSPEKDVKVDEALERVKVLYYEEGRGATVSVYDIDGRRVFQVNGHTEAGDALLDLHHQLTLGHVPALLHPDPRSAVVIGLGAGCTIGALAAHDSIEDLTLVEIEPAVLGVAREFADINGRVLENPRLKIVYQDGRNYMLTTDKKFDIITADPLHPWSRGAGYLYTVEYYAMLAAHLNEGGILCQWLGLYELTDDNIRSIVRSFAENFEHVSLWQAAADVLLIGSDSPFRVDPRETARRIADPDVAHQLGYLGLDEPFSFLAEHALDDAAVRELAKGAVINTDDNLHIEFSSPLSTGEANREMVVRIASDQTIPAEMVTNSRTKFGPGALEQVLERYVWAKKHTIQATVQSEAAELPEEAANQLLRQLEKVCRTVPPYGRARVLYAHLVSSRAEQELRVGRYRDAIRFCSKALQIRPGYGKAHRIAGRALIRLGRFEEAVAELRKDIESRSLRYWESYEPLSIALAALGRQSEAIRVLEDGLAERPRDDRLIARLSWLLATSPEPDLRDGPRAARLAEKAIASSDRPAPFYLEALAAALAETGRFPEAVERAEEAVRLANQEGATDVPRGMRERLDLYRAGKPWRGGFPNETEARPES